MKPWFYSANRNLSVLVCDGRRRAWTRYRCAGLALTPSGTRSQVHVHRLVEQGGRAERGMALSPYSDKERHKVERLEAALGQAIEGKPPVNRDNWIKLRLAADGYAAIDGGKSRKCVRN